MNKKILTIVFALVFPLTISAAPNDNGEHGWHHGNKLEHLTKELGLTDDQKAKLEPILKQQEESFKAAHEANKKLIEGVLTPEQIAKWEELKKQHHEKWQKHHDGSHNNKSAD
jgi:Spy/CpxP family protein refolding chaperone